MLAEGNGNAVFVPSKREISLATRICFAVRGVISLRNSSSRALITSTFSSMFLWGILASIAPLSHSWPFTAHITGTERVLLVLIGPILAILGNFGMGFLSDIFGRRRVFILTMSLYIIGTVVISFSFSVLSLLAGIALAQFGIAGEEIPTIALLAEDTPKRKMSFVITNGLNFANIGSAFIAGLLIIVAIGNLGIFLQRMVILIPSLGLIGIIVYSRLRLPESYRWLKSKGRVAEAEKEATSLGLHQEDFMVRVQKKINNKISFAVLTMMALSQYLTFGLMAYIVPYYEFKGVIVSYLVFFGVLGASVAGPIAGWLISKGRKNYSLFAFAGGFVTTCIILFEVGNLANLAVYIPLLFINMVFSEFAWASRTTLEPELFPTPVRGTRIGLVRLVPMIAYPVTIYLFANFSLFQEILSNVVLWAIGLAGALIWFIAGVETRNLDLDFQAV
ncbi:MAG: MFS transporter [Thermoplasmatales archaeon]